MSNPYGWGQNEPQIKPKDQGGDTIATFSQKIYNLFDNLFNTLNSYPWSTATQSDAGYMSATDKTNLDNAQVVTMGTLTRLKDPAETTNSVVFKVGHVGFFNLLDNFPTATSAYTYYNLFTSSIHPTKEIYGQCTDIDGKFVGRFWINTNGSVYVQTLATAPSNTNFRMLFVFPC